MFLLRWRSFNPATRNPSPNDVKALLSYETQSRIMPARKNESLAMAKRYRGTILFAALLLLPLLAIAQSLASTLCHDSSPAICALVSDNDGSGAQHDRGEGAGSTFAADLCGYQCVFTFASTAPHFHAAVTDAWFSSRPFQYAVVFTERPRRPPRI